MPIQLDHVAFGVPKVADTVDFLVGELGGVPEDGGPAREFTGGQWSFAGGARLEVLEPLGSGGFMERFVQRRGRGAHHVTLKVPDLRAICARAGDLGYDVVGFDASHRAWMEAFLHPKQAQGLVVQFAETHPEAGGDGWGDWEFPQGPADPPEPAGIVALHLSSRDEAAARRQWATLCGGEEVASLVFRWPDSPIALRVEVDRERDEGPLFLEVVSERRLELAAAPRVLGLPFRQR